MLLADMPLSNIKPGLRVRSIVTGNYGMVGAVSVEMRGDQLGFIWIHWDYGKNSAFPYYDPDYGADQAYHRVEVIEE